MGKMTLTEQELQFHNWSMLRDACGSAEHVGLALAELSRASTPEQAECAYWKIENHVVVQGSIYEAAIAAVPVLLAMLADDSPSFVRISALELIYQIVSGEPGDDINKEDGERIKKKCILQAKLGQWLLYRELVYGSSEGARDVLVALEDERVERLRRL